MPELYGSAGFLFHPDSGQVLLHHRDAHAPRFPNHWSDFGGTGEPGDGGDPVTTWQRELREELGITLQRQQIVPLRVYLSPHTGHPRHVFYVSWPTLDTDVFVLGEGDGFGWFSLAAAIGLPDIVDLSRDDLLALREVVVERVPGNSRGDNCRPPT